MKRKVVHLIPYDTVGGVETAARTIPAEWTGRAGDINFRRAYLVTHSPVEVLSTDWHGPEVSVNHPLAHWKLFRDTMKIRPDLLIASLWRSCPTLIACKLFNPKTRSVLFLHSAVDVHIFDRFFNRAAMYVVDEIWADSDTTLQARVPKAAQKRAKVLSFLTQRPGTKPIARVPDGKKPIPPDFVFWGRLQSEKNLGLALDVFAEVHKRFPEARLDIIGPDRGALPELRTRVAELDLGHAVNFPGALPQSELSARASSYRFYLQTSRFEGMAMSVIEAMGMGLVPVVTPVGEIPSYCIDGENGIHVTTPVETAERIVALVEKPENWHILSERAVRRWADTPLYQDDYCAACESLLMRSKSEMNKQCAD